MNRLNRSLYLLAAASVAAVLSSGCDRANAHMAAAGRDAKVTVNRTWPSEGIRELHVSETNGSISVEAAPVSEITLVARAYGDLEIKQGAENEGLFETALEGGVLRVGRKRKERTFNIPLVFGRKPNRRIDYTLRVPPHVGLSVTTVNGKIATRGMESETSAVSVNGTIDVESSGAHELTATTVNGRVKARFLESFHGARFKTVNGGVTAFLPPSASFNVDLSQVNGDFEASFPLSINSNPGSRRVSGEVNGGEHELRIVTVNGDISLSRLD
jgi:hypothetical protein